MKMNKVIWGSKLVLIFGVGYVFIFEKVGVMNVVVVNWLCIVC